MVMLLGSRGQHRGRNNSGFAGALRRVGTSALRFVGFTAPTNVRRGETRASRGSSSAGWIALGGALAVFGLGFLVGRSTSGPGSGAAQLKAEGGSGPTQPAMIPEFDSKPMGSTAFVVSAYPNVPVEEAKTQAKALSDWLRSQQIQKARPFEYEAKAGMMWVVAVYYDGPAEEAATRTRLQSLPEDVPDEMFVWNRKNKPEDWPFTLQIR